MSKKKLTRKEKQRATAARKKAAATKTPKASPASPARPVNPATSAATNTPARAPVKTKAKTSTSASTVAARPLTFGREFYLWMGGGFLLVLVGMLLMAGGEMPSPDVWDEDIIYSFRRVTLAPLIILGGIGVVIYAIFKK